MGIFLMFILQHPSQSRRSRGVRGLMSGNSSSDEFDDDHRPQRAKELVSGQPGASPNEEEEDDEEDDDSEEEDSDDDDAGPAPEGVYDPADYANLPVSTEIKELFQYIIRSECSHFDSLNNVFHFSISFTKRS